MKYKALFVGIDKYTHGIPALSCARNDANELFKYFTEHGYASDDIEILRNGTTREILDALDKQTQTLKPGDFFLFFFAGHGYTLEKDKESYERCLAGADDTCDRIMRGKDGIALSEIRDIADKAQCTFVVILDACQTKINSKRAMNSTPKGDSKLQNMNTVSEGGCKARDLLAITTVVNRPRNDKKKMIPFVVINSCGVNEDAYELEKMEQGLFTFAMLETFAQMEAEGMIPRFNNDFIQRISEIMENHGGGYRQHPTLILPESCNVSKIPIFPVDPVGVAPDKAQTERLVPNFVGKPYPAERLVLKFRDIQLELYARRDVVLGREPSMSDVIVRIPKGAMGEEMRKKLCDCISGRHAQLKQDGDAVWFKDLHSSNGTYIKAVNAANDSYKEDDKISSEGMMLKKDEIVGFSSDVSWKVRVQTCTGWSRLSCREGCHARGVKSVILEYPGWTALYKVFVWPCCELNKVDSRLPDWQIGYQDDAQGKIGAFYLLIGKKKFIYLQPEQKIMEDGIEVIVKNSCNGLEN